MPRSQECWQAKYRNDSRPWLVGSAEIKTSPEPTTMRESFLHPDQSPKQKYGRRKELFEKFLFQKVREELKREMMEDPADENKVSEYKESFCENIELSDSELKTEKDKELIQKHPLYTEAPQTIWMDKMKNLGGKTESSSSKPLATFHKNASFTKPIDKVLDKQKPGTLGYV